MQDPNVTPQAPDEFAAQAMNSNQPLLQTPTMPPAQPILPKIERGFLNTDYRQFIDTIFK